MLRNKSMLTEKQQSIVELAERRRDTGSFRYQLDVSLDFGGYDTTYFAEPASLDDALDYVRDHDGSVLCLDVCEWRSAGI